MKIEFQCSPVEILPEVNRMGIAGTDIPVRIEIDEDTIPPEDYHNADGRFTTRIALYNVLSVVSQFLLSDQNQTTIRTISSGNVTTEKYRVTLTREDAWIKTEWQFDTHRTVEEVDEQEFYRSIHDTGREAIAFARESVLTLSTDGRPFEFHEQEREADREFLSDLETMLDELREQYGE